MNPPVPEVVEKPKPPPAPLALRILFKPVDLGMDLAHALRRFWRDT